MEERLKELYFREIERSCLDFDGDPEYRKYYTQAQALWEGGDMPYSLYRLLDTANFLAFAHGFRLGAGLREMGVQENGFGCRAGACPRLL